MKTENTPNTSSVSQESDAGLPVWPGIVIGFSAAIAMWLVWYPLHLPGLQLPVEITGPLLMLVMLIAIALGSKPLGRRAAPAGLLAGLASALVNLLLLGNQLSKTSPDGTALAGAEGLKPDAPLIIAGFIGASLVIGLIAGFIGSKLGKGTQTKHINWLARFGVAAVLAMFPLVIAGGAVTSSGAGMSVPDWPGTYGSNMFLYPIGLMADPRIFLEHTHRLFGTLVGLTTMVLMIAVLIKKPSTFARILAVVLFVAVCIQGLLGALRVTENNPGLGVAHGVFAQLVLAAAALLAATLTASWQNKPAVNLDSAGRARKLANLAVPALIIQLALAALYRHLGSQHALLTHMAFSLIVTGLLAMLAFSLYHIEKETPNHRLYKKLGNALLHGVGFQFVLGFAAFMLLRDHEASSRVVGYDQLDTAPDIPVAGVIVATLHQANGAALLMFAVLAAAWTRRIKPAPEPAHAPES